MRRRNKYYDCCPNKRVKPHVTWEEEASKPIPIPPRNDAPVQGYGTPAPNTLQQYTPEYRSGTLGGAASIRYHTTYSATADGRTLNSNQGADGARGWYATASDLNAVQFYIDNAWDGSTPNICSMTNAQRIDWAFPGTGSVRNYMRGLKQVYDTFRPFEDEVNPTVAEIDAWNIRVIKHFRDLFGITTPISPEAELYLKCLWADERKWTTVWDTAYPALTCPTGSGAHCGAGFVPNCAEQAPYLTQYPGQTCVTNTDITEGVGGINTAFPWFFKLARQIFEFLYADGITGHTGPFLQATKMGMSFMETGTTRFKPGGINIDPCS